MGILIKIAALGLLYFIHQGSAVMLSCKEYDTKLIRKGVYIQSEVGRDGEWVTHAHSYRVYRNETVKKRLKVHFHATECGNMAVVFPKSTERDPNSPAGSDIILIDRPEPMSSGTNEEVEIVSSNDVNNGDFKGWYSNRPTKAPQKQKENLRIYSRQEWGAKDLSHEMSKRYRTPPTEVIVGDTQSGTCRSFSECAKILRGRQQRSTYGLFVNFMVGNGGMIFEGRGWDHESGRSNTFIVDVIGSYMKNYPPESEMVAVRKLLDYGVKKGKIAQNYKLYMAKDIGWGVK